MKELVELWRIELQSKNKLQSASTCLETLFRLIGFHTMCKTTPDESQGFILR